MLDRKVLLLCDRRLIGHSSRAETVEVGPPRCPALHPRRFELGQALHSGQSERAHPPIGRSAVPTRVTVSEHRHRQPLLVIRSRLQVARR